MATTKDYIGIQNYHELTGEKVTYLHTGINKFDDFFSFKGGIGWGTLNYITGSSGAGKTTVAAMLSSIIKDHKSAMYQRESLGIQVRDRNENLDFHKNCFIADSKTCPHLDNFMDEADEHGLRILIIDSLQVVALDYVDEAGSEKAAEKMVYMMLLKWVQRTGGIVLLIGHVNKDDGFKGDNGIMQMMDSHLEFIYDDKAGESFCRFGQKNRLGLKGNDNILFYNFKGNGNGVEFFTEQEWRVIFQRRDIFEYIAPRMQEYTDAFKDKEGYREFKSEIKAFQKPLLDDDSINKYQLLGMMLTKIGELVEEYEFIK
jgi:predicted ATP-dependent serine protease